MTAVYILLIIIALIMLLSLVRINVVADFSYKSENNELYIKFLFIKSHLYPKVKKDVDKGIEDYEENPEKINKETAGILERLAGAKYLYTNLKKDILKLLNYTFEKAIAIDELNISGVIGTGNPMYTGLVYGAVNSVVFGFLGTADRKMKLEKHHTDIKADFDNAVFSAGVYAVIYTRAMYLYYMAAKAAVIYIKLKRILKEERKMSDE